MLKVQGLAPAQIAEVLRTQTRVVNALDAALRASDGSRILIECARRVAQLLHVQPPWPGHDGGDSSLEAACIAFTEQWVIDVSSMSDDLVAAVHWHVGDDGLADFIHSLLMIEQRIRLELAWQHLQLSHHKPTDEGESVPLRAWGWGADQAVEIKPLDTSAVPPTTGRISPGRHGNRSLTAALSEFQAAVVCLDAVDPVTTELVRLRCANYHDCHT